MPKQLGPATGIIQSVTPTRELVRFGVVKPAGSNDIRIEATFEVVEMDGDGAVFRSLSAESLSVDAAELLASGAVSSKDFLTAYNIISVGMHAYKDMLEEEQ